MPIHLRYFASQVQSCHGKIIFSYVSSMYTYIYITNIHFPNDPLEGSVYSYQAVSASEYSKHHTLKLTISYIWLQAIKTQGKKCGSSKPKK